MNLFTRIDTQTTFITPNRRLCATFIKKYNAYQLAQQKMGWPGLDCLPFHHWAERTWRMHQAQQWNTSFCLLSELQEQIIWEDIIRQSASNSLLQTAAAAESALAAWGLLKQWQIDLNHPLLSLTEDSRTFLMWAQKFKNFCEKQHWLDKQSLVEKLYSLIQEKPFVLSIAKLVVLGFSELTPLQKKLFSACEKNGISVEYIESIITTSPVSVSNQASRLCLADEETEIFSMARWSYYLVNQARHNQLPMPSIACIVPQLENLRDRVEQIFLQVFLQDPPRDHKEAIALFNISAGKTLISYPLVHAALEWLTLPLQSIPFTKLSYLLRSPFLGEGESERFRRAQLDILARDNNLWTISLVDLLSLQKKINLSSQCPHLAKRLHAFVTYFTALPAELALSEWAYHFNELLFLLGWPGERSLTSHEYQIVQRWLELTRDYQTIHVLQPKLNYSQALYYLTYMAKQTIYQPQSPEAPVQILGTLEAAGLPFDYLWAMGFDDTAWPPLPKPNPFVPTQLQKKHRMPHASPEREWDYSMRTVQQFQKNAPYSLFSHAQKNLGFELRPSTLILHLPELSLSDILWDQFDCPAKRIFQDQPLEEFVDEKGPPLTEQETKYGGATLLKYQATCPFKAFATYRLKAHAVAVPSIGIRTPDRGAIIHKALEQFWQTIQTQSMLLDQSDDFLQSLLRDCLSEAIEKILPQATLSSTFIALETQRLQQLLWQWLVIEKNRPPFKVLACEQGHTTTLGPLSLQLRIDRIDELTDGSQFIIDYKTGKNISINDWFSSRPEELQLPLYCIGFKGPISAISFAMIHAETLGFKGACQTDIDIAGIKPLTGLTWEEQQQQWETILIQLANDFSQGKAKPDPKQADQTCRQCHLQALCRIS